MSGLAKSMVATALTLPLLAFVVGVLATPDDPAPDRSRPVIIGQVDDDGDDRTGRAPPRSRERDRPHDRAPADRRPGESGDADDESGDDAPAPPGPVTVVTPPPRDLGDGDDDDGVGDDDDSDGDADDTDDDGDD